MKYLETYKIFESSSEIETEIREVLADLTDDGDFMITIDIMPPGTPISKQLVSDRENIDILIFNPGEETEMEGKFAYLDIKDSVVRLVEHLSDRYNLVSIKVLIGHNRLDIYPRFELETVSPLPYYRKSILRHVDIKFKKK